MLERIWYGVERHGHSVLFPKREAVMPIVHLIKSSSLYSGKGLWKLAELIDIKKVLNSPIQLDIVAHNISKNNEHAIFSNKDSRFQENPELFRKALIASASIHGFFPPVEIFGERYLDGLYYMLEPAIVFGCDTIFILTIDHSGNRDDAEWSRLILQPFNIMLDKFFEHEIPDIVREHPEFQVFGVEESSIPLLEHIRRGIIKLAKSLVGGEVPRRIVPVIIRHESKTLNSMEFQKGDFKTAIERGYEQANIILDRLMAT